MIVSCECKLFSRLWCREMIRESEINIETWSDERELLKDETLLVTWGERPKSRRTGCCTTDFDDLENTRVIAGTGVEPA